MATLQDINERMRTTVFTEGEHYANVFVRELFVEPECLGVVTPGRKLSIIYARDKQVFGYNSIVIAETDSSNTIYENNRFVAIGEMCGVITFIGEGGFSTFKCYIIVNWDTTWSLNQIDGNVNNGELYFTSEINVSVASKIEFSPTIAAWLKSPEYTTKVLPDTIFLTQQSDILNERVSFPLNSSNGTLTEDNTCNIYIDSQEAFENLYLNIYNATLNNKTIVNIVFDGGTYFFRYNSGNAFIDINDNVFNNVELHFIGNKSTIIGETSPLQLEGIEKGYYVYSASNTDIFRTILVDDKGKFVTDFYGNIHEMDGLVEFSNNATSGPWVITNIDLGENSVMRIPHQIDCIYAEDVSSVFVQVYSDFYSQIFKVISLVGNNYILAKTTLLDGPYDSNYVAEDSCWRQNKRQKHSSCLKPCFKLINFPAECPVAFYNISTSKLYTKLQNVHLCNITKFLSLRTNIKTFSISGFNFSGNMDADEYNDVLIEIKNSTGMKYIQNCEFHNIRSSAIRIENSSNTIIQNNLFSHYYRKGVFVLDSTSICILNNSFFDGNLRHINDGGIVVQNSECYVANNKLTDYGYIGIGVGTWYGSPLAIDRKIIVEFNELYMNPEYRSKYSCVPLLDGGAIYTWTKNTNTIIRYNFISGHSGAWNNRGIFCDDGSNHIKLYGNLIINTNNSFSIDLRYEDNNNNNNEGNIILNNIIDGIYRFEGKQSAGVGNEPSIKGRNLLLAEHYSPQKHNICRYIEDSDMENDNVLLCCRIKEHEVLLPYDMRNKLYNLNLPEFILSHIRFINF